MRKGSMTAVVAAVALLAAVPTEAVATGHPSYQLKKSSARCRTGYVRQVRHVKKRQHGKTVTVREVWCVYKAPSRTATNTDVDANATNTGTETDILVSGWIWYGSPNFGPPESVELKGQPITYTISDATTGKFLGSFVGTSNSAAYCSVVETMNAQGTIETFTGQALPPTSACALSPISMPAADSAEFTGSFAGTKTFASSVSRQKFF
jgi:hypothetical protein